MIKFICNKCGSENGKMTQISFRDPTIDTKGKNLYDVANRIDLCEDCYDLYKRLSLDISDFMETSFGELNLLDNTFKVGDKVITDDGRVGTIESICDCERCKDRGFYEPTVELETGHDRIWITDTDKNNGFMSFYSIGNHVYGNIDEECLHRQIASNNEIIVEHIKRSKELDKQLEVLKKCKAEQEGAE